MGGCGPNKQQCLRPMTNSRAPERANGVSVRLDEVTETAPERKLRTPPGNLTARNATCLGELPPLFRVAWRSGMAGAIASSGAVATPQHSTRSVGDAKLPNLGRSEIAHVLSDI